jgi:hypothetical protein
MDFYKAVRSSTSPWAAITSAFSKAMLGNAFNRIKLRAAIALRLLPTCHHLQRFRN